MTWFRVAWFKVAVVTAGRVAAIAALVSGCATFQGGAGGPDLAALIAAADRSPADVARDEGRRPAEVLTFLGLEPGMQVIDLVASSGYYSEVMAAIVGADGVIYAQNPAAVLQFRDGANDKAMKARLAGGRLPNVLRWDREISDIGLAPESLDMAFTALNLHDVYNRDPEQAVAFLKMAFGLLKPGGIMGIIDHVGVTGADNAKLHRVPSSEVRGVAEAAGFVIEAQSDLLANAADDHTTFVFDPAIRGKTDRFVLRLRKPTSS